MSSLLFSAWFFFKLMKISGAEAVAAAGSPWVGQGESACLVRPFVDLMTASELHLTMTSGVPPICRNHRLNYKHARRVHHTWWACPRSLYFSWCSGSKSHYVVCHEHSRFNSNQQNAHARD